MSIRLQTWLNETGYGTAYTRQAVAGGCISEAARLLFSDGRRLFIKRLANAPTDMFHREAEGLRALLNACSNSELRIPEVIAVDEEFLILEDLGAGRRHSQYWEQLGRGLAALHQHTQQCFGFSHDNYCGSTPQCRVDSAGNRHIDRSLAWEFTCRAALALQRRCR